MNIEPFYGFLTRPMYEKATCPHVNNLSCTSHPGEDKGGSLSVSRQPCWMGRRGSDRCVMQDQRETLPLVTRPFIFICIPAGCQHTASVVHTDFKTLHGSKFFCFVVFVCCFILVIQSSVRQRDRQDRLPPITCPPMKHRLVPLMFRLTRNGLIMTRTLELKHHRRGCHSLQHVFAVHTLGY